MKIFKYSHAMYNTFIINLSLEIKPTFMFFLGIEEN